MAIAEISGTRHFIGADGDTKPTSGIPAGSTFLAVTAGDPATARRYVFNGSSWALEVQTTEAVSE
jgi:hypothetical protein